MPGATAGSARPPCRFAVPNGGDGPGGEATVAALVVVNAVGDAFTLEGEPADGWAARPRPGTRCGLRP